MSTKAVLHSGTKLIRFTMVFIFILAFWLVPPAAVSAAESGSGDGQFYAPNDVAVDSSGNIYVSDSINARIQKFDSSGNFITKWGSYGSGDGKFNYPVGIAVDSEGNFVYVADNNNHRIQKFDSSGNFITKWDSYGTGQGQFLNPKDVTVDSSGNFYVVDTYKYISGEWIWPDYHIQKFTSSGNFITGWGPYGDGDGEFMYPTGIAVDSSGSVYVTDFSKWPNQRIQKFDSSGNFIAKWGSYGSGNGQFSYPQGIAVYSSDEESYIYVADTGNNRIQKFDSEGGFLIKWGSEGTGDGQFNLPEGIAVDSSGSVYVADTGNHRIQKFTSDGQLSNIPPGADAGPDQIVNEGTVVNLAGYGYDVNGHELTFQWGQTDGQEVDLSNSNSLEASFSAPQVDSDEELVFQLTVDDGDASASDTVKVTILDVNTPPVADAGDDQTVVVGNVVNLDGSASYDPDDDSLTYSWSLFSKPDGSNAVLSGTDTITPSLITDLPGEYVVQLVVNDGKVSSDPDSVTITAQTPQEAIQSLIEQVDDLVNNGTLNQGQGKSVIAKLETAIKQLDRGNTNAAIGQLQAFIKQVNTFMNVGILSQEEGQPLIETANGIIAAL